jgi:zona occludens toxin
VITLITGTPGAGKTLYTVAEELPKFKDRPLFIDGIPDLAINHLEPVGKVEQWHEWIPDGAVLVIDEVQRIWRPRGTASAVPPGVAALETHRHKGVDLVIITQHPNLLDPNIRRLVGRHLHVRRMFGWKRAIVYEWDSATDPARVSNAIKRSWAYPKKAFKLYKSAEVHTKRGNRVPFVVVAAVLAIVAVPVGWYYALDRTAAKWMGGDEIAAEAATEPATARAGGVSPPAALPVVPPRLVEAMTPTDDHNPLSAPLYAAVVPQVVAPVVTGCIASSRACTCYSQQQTPVWVPDEQCRQRAAGLYYDPYRQPPPESQTQQASAHRQGTEATAPAGGSSRAPTGPVPSTPSPPQAGESAA